MSKVAVVVGGDQGIGPNVVKQLCEQFNGKLYITTKDYIEGKSSAENLIQQGIDIEFLQLDINSVNSIINLRTHIQENEGVIDLLINNACIDYCSGNTSAQIRQALNTNFYGNLNLSKLIYPLICKDGQVIIVTSPVGLLSAIPGENIRTIIRDPGMTEDGLVELMQEYEKAGQRGTEQSEGWGHRPVAVSKVALSALTFMQQKNASFSLNCVSPRNVDSEDGTKAIMYLALNYESELRGKFIWSDLSEVNWCNFVETDL